MGEARKMRFFAQFVQTFQVLQNIFFTSNFVFQSFGIFSTKYVQSKGDLEIWGFFVCHVKCLQLRKIGNHIPTYLAEN